MVHENLSSRRAICFRGEFLESLRDNIPKNTYPTGINGLVLLKSPEQVFGTIPSEPLVGRELILAFNGGLLDGCGIRNMYDPFKGKPYTKEELEQFKNDLKKKTFFPYAACLQVTIKDVKQNAANSKLSLKVLVDKVITNSEFRVGQLANFEVESSYWLTSLCKLDQVKNKSFVWSFNPIKTNNPNTYRANEIRADVVDEKVDDRIAEIEREISLLPKKIAALKSAVQANMEMRWPIERIKMYLKNPIAMRPENKIQRPFSRGDKYILTGELYPERQNEIGKIVWAANLFPDKYNMFTVKLTKDSKTYLLGYDWISLVPLAPNEAETTMLTEAINEIFDSRNERQKWRHGVPNHLFGEIVSNEPGNRIFKILLSGEGHHQLTANFNEDLNFTEIFVDGKSDLWWNDTLKAAKSKGWH
ncbi:MAG: hypothetical protein SFY67_09335 [Candidatus Melainabacteria bacterium]|nr:hypothetical protein [Candidatus Melainabacteria bacterium]